MYRRTRVYRCGRSWGVVIEGRTENRVEHLWRKSEREPARRLSLRSCKQNRDTRRSVLLFSPFIPPFPSPSVLCSLPYIVVLGLLKVDVQ